MGNNNEQNSFSYTYSAKEQAELKRIREKYSSNSEKEDKMERIRRLDAGVTQKAQIVSLVLGIIGALILGFGLSLIMSDLGDILGAHRDLAIPIGIIIGIIGCVPVGLAYPLYNVILKQERERVAPEILRLTDELMK